MTQGMTYLTEPEYELVPRGTLAELTRLRMELLGEQKANALLLAGMESTCEDRDRLKQEVRRLRRGDFTPEEFQNLCHHRDEKPGCTRTDFEDGCQQYQTELFGPRERAPQ